MSAGIGSARLSPSTTTGLVASMMASSSSGDFFSGNSISGELEIEDCPGAIVADNLIHGEEGHGEGDGHDHGDEGEEG